MRQSENDWNGKKSERRVRMGECEKKYRYKDERRPTETKEKYKEKG